MESCQLHFDEMPIPEEDRIGAEKGRYYLFDGLNPERIMVATEAIGLARAALRMATDYAKERVVFGRPIGQNQGVQHPLVESWMKVETANLTMHKAAPRARSAARRQTPRSTCARRPHSRRSLMDLRRLRVRQRVPRRKTHALGALLTRIVLVSPNRVLFYSAERVLDLAKSLLKHHAAYSLTTFRPR
jgi:acyl-CoA dehydrogenase